MSRLSFLKNLLATSVLISSISASADLQTLPQPVNGETLTSILTVEILDPNMPELLGGTQLVNGILNLSPENGILSITFNYRRHCPAGLYCTAMMPAPQTIALPLVPFEDGSFTQEDSCGSVYYKAKSAGVDEQYIQRMVTVVDNTNNRCPHLIALEPTVVEYRTSRGGFYKDVAQVTFTRFAGTELQVSPSFDGPQDLSVEILK